VCGIPFKNLFRRARSRRVLDQISRTIVSGVIALTPLQTIAVHNAESEDPTSRYGLPVAARWLDKEQIMAPHHDYPAWDMFVPSGTPVVAAHAGTVKIVLAGEACGNGLMITGKDGFIYTYCHGTKVLVEQGDKVALGDKILISGGSGSAERPHLHFDIRTEGDQKLCPQPLLLAWWRGEDAEPRSTSPRGCIG
jgi:Peptidase family M23